MCVNKCAEGAGMLLEAVRGWAALVGTIIQLERHFFFFSGLT